MNISVSRLDIGMLIVISYLDARSQLIASCASSIFALGGWERCRGWRDNRTILFSENAVKRIAPGQFPRNFRSRCSCARFSLPNNYLIVSYTRRRRRRRADPASGRKHIDWDAACRLQPREKEQRIAPCRAAPRVTLSRTSPVTRKWNNAHASRRERGYTTFNQAHTSIRWLWENGYRTIYIYIRKSFSVHFVSLFIPTWEVYICSCLSQVIMLIIALFLRYNYHSKQMQVSIDDHRYCYTRAYI